MNRFFSNEILDGFDPSKNWEREDLPEQGTWDLTKIFPDDEAWSRAFDEMKVLLETADKYAGKLSESADQLLAALRHYEKIVRKAEVLGLYAHLKKDQNQANSEYAAMEAKTSQLFARLGGKLAFMKPELTEIDLQVFESFVEDNEDLKLYKHYFDNIVRHKDYVLSEVEETLLAKAGDTFDAGAEVFSIFSNADLKFPKVRLENAEEIEITQANYISLLENKNRDLRKEVFEKYFATYKQFENTLALTLQKQVKQDNYLAEVRGHKDARAAALFNNAIPEKVHNQLLETVSNNLDLLHRYVAIRKESLAVDELHCYDLYTSMVEDVDFSFTPSQAQELVIDALQPMGPEYIKAIEEAFSERWIDWFPNQGKRSGAYSSGATYDALPYILLNWQGNLNSVYTLIHELGHSVHSYFSDTQPYLYSSYSIFLAEIASTANENLLTDYLLKKEKDPARRRYIINHYLDGFKGTVFRQTQFAKFEHLIHQADQNGTPLTADYLNKSYGQINSEFYGPSLYPDEEISTEWIRIPHFYFNYYVYQYATGFSAATAFTRQILEEGKPARDRFLKFLKSGSSDYPIEVLKASGLDMTKKEPIELALESFKYYLDLFEAE